MIDQEDLRYLDDVSQQAYMAFVRRFESDDWKSIVEWAESRVTYYITRETSAKNWDGVIYARGQRSAMQEIVNLETETMNQFMNVVAEAKAQEIAKDEEEHE